MHPMLNIAISAARSASRIMLRYYDRLDTLEIRDKQQHDFVTQVDEMCEQEIIAHIKKAYPNHAIIAEESGESPGDGFTWIIDPLDGTTNFAHGFPQFCISIAVKSADRLEVGLVYDPLRQELFTATRGSGAFLNNKRIRVSQNRLMSRALIGTGFPFKNKELIRPYLDSFANVAQQVAGVRRPGAAALDLAYVANGRLDGFWEAELNLWDYAAGALLIKEAGGIISNFDGQETLAKQANLVAGNMSIHQQLMQAIKVNIRT